MLGLCGLRIHQGRVPVAGGREHGWTFRLLLPLPPCARGFGRANPASDRLAHDANDLVREFGEFLREAEALVHETICLWRWTAVQLPGWSRRVDDICLGRAMGRRAGLGRVL